MLLYQAWTKPRAGMEHRSVHCVQPLPVSGTLSQEVLTGHDTRKRQISTPVASPMPVDCKGDDV